MSSVKRCQSIGILIAAAFLASLFLAPVLLAAPVVKPRVEPTPSKMTESSTAPVAPARADVIVKSIQVVPAQPKVGEAFEIHIELFNQGNIATGPGQKCLVGIEPGAFTPDPLPLEGSIAPNQSKLIVNKYVFMQAGNYAVLVRPIPGPSDATIKTFTVSPSATAGKPAQTKEPPSEKGLNVHPGSFKRFDPQPEPPGFEEKINPKVQPQ